MVFMENLMEILKTDAFLGIMFGLMILLLIAFIVVIFQYSKLNKRYQNFMKKLGEGKSLEEDLETYMYRVDKVEKQNAEISNQVKNLDKDLMKCIQKVGMVRYNAFKDTGSNLSFALAMLDENDDGVVLNGIYSREMSNIYAKPVEKGKSTYTLSEEETQAIQKAIDSNGIYKVK